MAANSCKCLSPISKTNIREFPHKRGRLYHILGVSTSRSSTLREIYQRHTEAVSANPSPIALHAVACLGNLHASRQFAFNLLNGRHLRLEVCGDEAFQHIVGHE